MDVFQKLEEGLDPLGGPLFIDRFVLTVRAAQRRRVDEEAERVRQEAERHAARATHRRRSIPLDPVRPAQPREAPSSASLEDEVEAFLTRDPVQATDDNEIQEFLKEKRGFDPTELD